MTPFCWISPGSGNNELIGKDASVRFVFAVERSAPKRRRAVAGFKELGCGRYQPTPESRTRRTLCSSASGLNGFGRSLACTALLSVLVSSVYPDM